MEIRQKDFDWSDYYAATKQKPPRPLLLKTLNSFFKYETGVAIDLGAGSGRDSLYLLKLGWKVFAVDKEKESISMILKETPPNLRKNLTCTVADFTNIKFGTYFDLCSAQLSLMFIKKNKLQELINHIYENLNENGIFVASFFAFDDDFVKNKVAFGVNEMDLKKYFDKFSVTKIEEEIKDGINISGKLHHSHILNIISKK